MVIDNQKGVVIPLQSEKPISIEKVQGVREEDIRDIEIEKKVHKIQVLIKALVKQSIKDTIKEYNLQLTEELKEYEKSEEKRWKEMEEHFIALDKNIREKQNEGKRKKHSIF